MYISLKKLVSINVWHKAIFTPAPNESHRNVCIENEIIHIEDVEWENTWI